LGITVVKFVFWVFFYIVAAELNEKFLLIRNNLFFDIEVTHDLKLLKNTVNPTFEVKKGICTHLGHEVVYLIKVI
jgi:hypothetical protein